MQLVIDMLDMVNDTLTKAVFETSDVVNGILPEDGTPDLMARMQIDQPAWLFIYLLVLLAYFAWIRMYYGNILTQTVRAAANFQVSSRMFNDNSLLQNQLDSVLYALYVLSVSFFLLLFEWRMGLAPYGLQGFVLYLFNLAFLLGLFIGRVVIVNLAGFLFNQVGIFREYIYNIFIFNKLMGIVLLPILLFALYTTGMLKEVVIWIAVATVTLVIAMRIVRGIVFSFKKDVSIFYTILYLCALEIVPLVLLYRWLAGIL